MLGEEPRTENVMWLRSKEVGQSSTWKQGKQYSLLWMHACFRDCFLRMSRYNSYLIPTISGLGLLYYGFIPYLDLKMKIFFIHSISILVDLTTNQAKECSGGGRTGGQVQGRQVVPPSGKPLLPAADRVFSIHTCGNQGTWEQGGPKTTQTKILTSLTAFLSQC